jgi:hypothetical protein
MNTPKIALSLSLLFSLTYADKLTHSLSYQGYSGLINIPNAQVMSEGDLTLHFDNQFDNALRGYDLDRPYSYKEDYIFGVGILPFIEVQLRLSEAPSYHRDLSGNFKFQLPFKHKYLPNIAFGYQDIGSAANHYGNRYVVVDKELSIVRLSAGYGDSTVEDEAKQRMNGLFYGAEVQAYEGIYLIYEDDSQEQFAGLRVELPKRWSSYFKLDARFTTNLSDNYTKNIGFNLTFPLYENRKTYSPVGVNLHKQEVYKLKNEHSKIALHKSKESLSQKKKKLSLDDLEIELKQVGLENITIAVNDREIYVGYENGVFAHNDIDAMGVVVALLTETQYTTFILEQKRSNVVTLTLSGDLTKADKFYTTPNAITKKEFASSLKKLPPRELTNYKIVSKNSNDSSFKPKVEFSPQLRTFVGNEFGVFNYKLWLRTKASMHLYQGLDITAVGDIHIDDSKIDDAQYEWFMKLYERESHMESVMLHYSTNLFGGVNTTSVGTFEENYIGGLNQYIVTLNNHTLEFKGGVFKEFQDGDAYKEFYFGEYEQRDFYIATYTYMFCEYDMLGEVNFGKYWNQDRGFEIKTKRYFEDVAVYMAFSYSKADNFFSEESNKFLGIGIEIPLTPKHQSLNRYIQVEGTNAFNYRLNTTIARDDGTNNIVSGGNYNPYVALSSEEYFYNRNRLQLSYIKEHLFRFIEANKLYK